MNCIDIEKNIGAMLDFELGDAQREQIERHLRICSDCRETREWMVSLSSLLQVNRIDSPSTRMDERVAETFRENYTPTQRPFWQHVVLGSFVIPKPAFATLLILAVAAQWFAFQIGKTNATSISVPAAIDAFSTSPVQIAAVSETKTVVVEVPVIRERIVTRTRYVVASGTNQKSREKRDAGSESNTSSSYSSIAYNGYVANVNLQGFQPTAEIGVRIIRRR